jgi:hypothetical protein
MPTKTCASRGSATRQLNSVMLRPPRNEQRRLKLPGRSGIVIAWIASRCSPTSARSATKRSRSKSVFAALATATKVRPRAPVRST